MERLILVLEVEPLPVGRFREWPLHCTLVHWFNFEGSLKFIVKELENLFKGVKPVELMGREQTMFGHRRDVPVNLIEQTPELMRMHKLVVNKLAELGVMFAAEQFLRLGYRPHVTAHGGRHLENGIRLASSAIYLVRSTGEKPKERIVVKRFAL